MNAENLTVIRSAALSQEPRSLVQTLTAWRKRVMERSQLARFDEVELRDLGLTETDVWREMSKAPWQA